MFLLIPLIIIFFSFAYLQVNENISILEYIIVYAIIILTIVFSYILYKRYKQDEKQRDINAMKQEINSLIFRIKKSSNEEEKRLLENKIITIQKEINDKL